MKQQRISQDFVSNTNRRCCLLELSFRFLVALSFIVVLAPRETAAQISDSAIFRIKRSAVTLPDYFVRDTSRVEPQPMDREGCPLRLRDPRSNATLVLRRYGRITHVAREKLGRASFSVMVGDYEPELEERYGVGRDELLRVNCASGAGIGIVNIWDSYPPN